VADYPAVGRSQQWIIGDCHPDRFDVVDQAGVAE
jgi:hypothetical protein